jgi:UDP-N-acetylmuramyl-tripeptide synthetase
VRCPVLGFGFERGAEVRAVEFHQRTDGTDIVVATPEGTLEIKTGLLGRPNIYNVLAAVGASLSLKLAPDTVCAGIEGVKGVPGRMERVTAGQAFQLIVDYAHTPDALKNMLATLRALPHGKLIIVFGCGGDRDRGKRPLMGEIAARMSDLVIATSDNPRTEDPLQILEEIEAGLRMGTATYELVVNRRDAIELAIKRARPEDAVVIAGKGHENYQIIGTRAYPFDDRAVARELILKLPNARAVRY